MKQDTPRQWINLLAIIVTIAINGLANALPLNGQTTGEISDRLQAYFVPAGHVFSIWGLIYVGLAAFAVHQLLPAQRDNLRLRRIGYLFVLSCLANIAWLFLWHYEAFPLTLVAMLVLLLSLIAICLRVEIGRTLVRTVHQWLVRIPFSIYLSWITAAAIANVTALLYPLNWSGWGISPQAWTVIMLVAGAGVVSAVSLTRGDVAYALVIVWAFAGIAVKHAATPLAATGAWVMTALVALIPVAGLLLKRRRERPCAPTG